MTQLQQIVQIWWSRRRLGISMILLYEKEATATHRCLNESNSYQLFGACDSHLLRAALRAHLLLRFCIIERWSPPNHARKLANSNCDIPHAPVDNWISLGITINATDDNWHNNCQPNELHPWGQQFQTFTIRCFFVGGFIFFAAFIATAEFLLRFHFDALIVHLIADGIS